MKNWNFFNNDKEYYTPKGMSTLGYVHRIWNYILAAKKGKKNN